MKLAAAAPAKVVWAVLGVLMNCSSSVIVHTAQT